MLDEAGARFRPASSKVQWLRFGFWPPFVPRILRPSTGVDPRSWRRWSVAVEDKGAADLLLPETLTSKHLRMLSRSPPDVISGSIALGTSDPALRCHAGASLCLLGH